MRKRLKKKKRSCAMCKPHKMGWEDRRTLQERKQDDKDKAHDYQEGSEDLPDQRGH